MTREDAKVILALMAREQELSVNNDKSNFEALNMAIKALEQEPCEDAISREMALKECHDIVVDGERYRVIQEETLLGLPSVNPQPCEDAISREATLKPYNGLNDEDTISVWLIRKNIEQQPSVNPTKTGHWIEKPNVYGVAYCSECDFEIKIDNTNYCPNCGAKMLEPQESEKINCKSTKCENCINHNYCDYEPQKSEG